MGLNGGIRSASSYGRKNVKIKSRVRWLQEGDRNTAYFHKIASCKRRSNVVTPAMVGLNEDMSMSELKASIKAGV